MRYVRLHKMAKLDYKKLSALKVAGPTRYHALPP